MTSPNPPLHTKAIFFDLMGTCCDWLSSLLPHLTPLPLPPSTTPHAFALAWRSAFFIEIHNRFQHNLPTEDIDTTHRRTLDHLLSEHEISTTDIIWNDELRTKLVQTWHSQTAWPDVIPALETLRHDPDTRWLLIVLANGTTRLQLDITVSALLPFHTLLSSEVLGRSKPDPKVYKRAMELVKLGAGDCVMVASHVYDLEAAKGVGMRTVYVQRDTEDVGVGVGEDGEGGGRGFGFVDVCCDGREGRDGFGVAARWLMGEAERGGG